jgi:hypothetical protein
MTGAVAYVCCDGDGPAAMVKVDLRPQSEAAGSVFEADE